MSAVTRVYLLLDLTQLERLHAQRHLPAGVSAFWVTPDVRAASEVDDEEELEFHALQAAASDAVARSRPVVVAAADLDPTGLDDASTSPALTTAQVGIQDVKSLHLSDDALAQVVPNSAPAVGGLGGVELSWFDITELPQILHRTI